MAILSNTEEQKEQEGGEWETIMKEIDTNQDGFIDFEEFRQHMHELLKKGEFNLRENLQKLSFKEKKKVNSSDSSEEDSDSDSGDQS